MVIAVIQVQQDIHLWHVGRNLQNMHLHDVHLIAS